MLINFAQLLMDSGTGTFYTFITIFLERYEWNQYSSYTSKLNTKCALSVSVMLEKHLSKTRWSPPCQVVLISSFSSAALSTFAPLPPLRCTKSSICLTRLGGFLTAAWITLILISVKASDIQCCFEKPLSQLQHGNPWTRLSRIVTQKSPRGESGRRFHQIWVTSEWSRLIS